MNMVVLKGRLSQDIKVSPSGKMCSSSIAVDRGMKDSNGRKITDFINLKWLGEAKVRFVSQYFHKGSEICVSGSIWNEKYEKDGQTHYMTSVSVQNTDFCGSSSDNNNSANGNNADGGNVNNNSAPDGFINIPDGIDDAVPFV